MTLFMNIKVNDEGNSNKEVLSSPTLIIPLLNDYFLLKSEAGFYGNSQDGSTLFFFHYDFTSTLLVEGK